MKKNRNGFTLIEILGVIIILSVLVIIAYPLVIKQTKNTTNDIDVATENLIKNAASNYVNDRYNEYVIGNSYCIKLQDLVDAGEVTEDMIKSNSTEIDVSAANVKVDTSLATNVEEFSYTISTDACYAVSQDVKIYLDYATTSKISVKTDYVSNNDFIWYVDGNEIRSCVTNMCLIENLNENTYHHFQVEVTDEDDNAYRSYEITYKTNAMIAPTCTVSTTDWASSKTVTFDVNMANDEELEYYYFYENDEFNREIIDAFPKEITLSENAIILAHVIDDYNIGGIPQNIKITKCVVDNIDDNSPTMSLSVSDGTVYSKTKTGTVTIEDTGGSTLVAGNYIIKYAWGMSEMACSDMTNTVTIKVTAGHTSASKTITIDNQTGAGKLYICNQAAIADTANNSLAAGQIKAADMYLDNTGPVITASPSSTSNAVRSISVLVDADDLSLNVSTAEYYLVLHNDTQGETSDDNVDNSEIGTFKQKLGGLFNIDDYTMVDGYLLGDVNKDSYVNSFDSALIKRYAVGLENFTDEQLKLADLDRNLKIEEKDDGDKVSEITVKQKNLFDGTYYLYIKSFTDSAGNDATAIGNVACNNNCEFNGIKYFKFGPYVINTSHPQMSLSITDGRVYSKTKTATVTIGAYGCNLSEGNYTIKYAWGTSAISCSSMTNTKTIAVTAGSTSASTTITINNNQTGAGKLYICNGSAITDTGNNSLAVGQIKAADMYLDNVAPTISLSVPNGTVYSKTKTGTVTIEDTGGGTLAAGNYTIKYAWGTSAISCSSMTNTKTIAVTAGSTSASTTITINNQNGAGKLYICNQTAIADTANNSLAAGQIKAADMYLDNIVPTISLSVPNGTDRSTIKTGTVTIEDTGGSTLAAGNYTIKYAWGTSAISCSGMINTKTIVVTAGSNSASVDITIDNQTGAGKLYICNQTAITDTANNSLATGQVKSADMYLGVNCRKKACPVGTEYYNGSCYVYYATSESCYNSCHQQCTSANGNDGSFYTCGQTKSPSCSTGTLKAGYCYLYNQLSCSTSTGWQKYN